MGSDYDTRSIAGPLIGTAGERVEVSDLKGKTVGPIPVGLIKPSASPFISVRTGFEANCA